MSMCYIVILILFGVLFLVAELVQRKQVFFHMEIPRIT